MSPNLAEVNIINLAGDAQSPAVSVSPAAPDLSGDAIAELRSSAAQLKAKILERTQRDVARQLKEQTNYKVEEVPEPLIAQYGSSGGSPVQIIKKDAHNDEIFAAIPIVAIVFTFLYLIVRALMAPFTNRAKRGAQPPVVMGGLSDEEAVILEKLQRTLTQMEARVESLETILIDPTRTKEKYGSKL